MTNGADAQPPDEYDAPWKEAITTYLPEFMSFFFPLIYGEIDWARGYVFQETDLQKIIRDAEIGLRSVDKLVRVWRLNGQPAWVLIHIEVQSQVDSAFGQRMFLYFYRIRDLHDLPVVSLAVLADQQFSWRPSGHHEELWGCQVDFTFPVVKVRDLVADAALLEGNRNPFATVVLAHVAAQDTRQQPLTRAQAKWAITRRLYDLAYEATEIRGLYRFIDWMLALPPALTREFEEQVRQYEEETQMPFITSFERAGLEKGRQEGLAEGRQEGLAEGLQRSVRLIVNRRFGMIPNELEGYIVTADSATLENLLEQLATAQSLDDLKLP